MNRRQLLLTAGIILLATFTLALKCGEDAPTTPELTPPDHALYQNAEIPLRVKSTQPQGKDVKYVVNWGDGMTDTSATDYPSGEDTPLRHVYPEPGEYKVKALAFVSEKPELVSDWSDEVTLTILSNQSPTNVRITWPERPIVVPRNRDVRFAAIAEDPEGDSVQYQFNFGDGTLSSWTTAVASGEPNEAFNKFKNLGVFYPKARARDSKGSMSGWSDSVQITVDTTGVVVWTWFTPDDIEGPAATSALVLMRNEEPVIYVGADDEAGRFWGIRAATGKDVVKSSSTDEDPYSGHPAYVAETGNIIAGCENGELYAFNVDLSTQWRWPDSNIARTEYIEWGVPAINGRRVYSTRDQDDKAGVESRIYCLTDNVSSVTYVAHHDVPGIRGNPVINAAGEVIVVTDKGQLLLLSANLSPVWDTVLTAGELSLTAPILGTAGHIYVGDFDGNVYCINPDRSVRWKTATPLNGEANMMVIGGTGDGALYVGTGLGQLYRLDPQNGSVVWQTALHNANDIETSPILTANGLIYVHDDQDALHCLKQDDGKEVWRIDLEEFAPTRSARRSRRAFEASPNSPSLTPDGDIVVVGMDALYLVAGYTEGTLMASPWPKWQGGIHNAGKAGSF